MRESDIFTVAFVLMRKNPEKVVARLCNPHKHWVFLLWRRGGIVASVGERETTGW